ncbi:transcription initiation factor IID, 18kD subunit-domain-containing protein [Scheffersomyces xylosifermentans]|uniref:transcription initiation factor IID, 18kD subunit-domain-containing protein n=1 Tax=Scheffersomyces xylosifermentans TaxID=1304137 RepID=UPI00315D038B
MRRPVYSTAAQPINTSLYPITQQLPPITNTKRKRRKQRLFQKDIENLLFAMGDRPVSTDLTVQALEEILVEYLTDLSRDILAYARSQGRNRIKMNDLMFALRNDPLKLARYQYTIEQSQRIERAKKLFEENDVSEAQVHAQNSSAEEEEEEEEEDRGLTKAGKKRKYKKKKRKVTGNVMFKSDEE